MRSTTSPSAILEEDASPTKDLENINPSWEQIVRRVYHSRGSAWQFLRFAPGRQIFHCHHEEGWKPDVMIWNLNHGLRVFVWPRTIRKSSFVLLQEDSVFYRKLFPPCHLRGGHQPDERSGASSEFRMVGVAPDSSFGHKRPRGWLLLIVIMRRVENPT